MSKEVNITLAEQFLSHQGEVQAGVLAYFIRTSGCINFCKHCDTKYSWDTKHGTVKTTQQIADDVMDVYNKKIIGGKARPWSNNKLLVVITGGEPLMWGSRLKDVILAVKSKTKYTNRIQWAMETSGNYKSDKQFLNKLDIINCCPKTPCLESAAYANPQHLNDLVKQAVRKRHMKMNLKFVVKDEEDMDFIRELMYDLENDVLNDLCESDRKKIEIWIMPFTIIQEGDMNNKNGVIENSVKKFCAEQALEQGWNISPRFHIDMKIL